MRKKLDSSSDLVVFQMFVDFICQLFCLSRKILRWVPCSACCTLSQYLGKRLISNVLTNNISLIGLLLRGLSHSQVSGCVGYRDYSFWRHLLLVCQLLSIRVSIFQASGPPNIDALLVCSSAHQTMNASVCTLSIFSLKFCYDKRRF